MANKKPKQLATLLTSVLKLARLHFGLVAVYAGYIIVSDAWNLITPETALRRWTMAMIMLVVTTGVWYMARNKLKGSSLYGWLVAVLILLDIAFATFNVYTQRGMASRAVMLFALPILMAAALRRSSAIYATATVSVAAYVIAAVRYFVMYRGEGYKVELYSEVGFYCAIFFVLAAALNMVLHIHKS